nr:MAG: MFS transporter [Hyphomicrobiales bacterium]
MAAAHQPDLRDFRFFLATRFLGTVAIQMQVVGVGWQVYGITNDPVSLGIVALIEFVPMLILALPAGDLADRVDRRLVIFITRLVEASGSVALFSLTLMGSQEVWHFYLVVLLFGLTRGVSTPTLQSSLPFLVTRKKLPSAIALSSSVGTIGNVSGPAIGGFLFAAGPALTYVTCFVLFLLAAATALQMHMRRPEQMPASGRAYQRIADGIKFMWNRQIIFGAITLDLFAVLVGGAVALLPVYARDILEVGPSGLGLLRSAPAFGAAIIGLFLARWPLDRYAGNCMFGFVAIFGVATIAFGLSSNFYLSMAALAVVGCADMFSIYIRHSLIQLATPDHMRGRVGSVNSLFISASNELGQFRAGLMAGWIGTVPAVIFGGVGALVIVGAFMFLFPALRKIDRFSDVAPNEP